MEEHLNIKFKNKNEIIYIKNNDNSQLYVIPECFFDVKTIYNLINNKSITLCLCKEIKKHVYFINIINEVYNKCNKYMKKRNINNVIINPLLKVDETNYKLYLIIKDFNGKKQVSFYDIENRYIDINDLKNKSFKMYPAIHIDKVFLNKNKNIAIINFILKEAFINDIK